jgi:lipoprotein-releasing system permease protein
MTEGAGRRMYKLLLATKYLKTRMIAFVSIISVTLGVATMIVVNSVMAGFSGEMQDRLRGLLSDIAIITHNSDGFEDPERLMQIIEESVGSDVVATTPTVEMWGMMSFHIMGQEEQRPVRIVGILPEGKNQVSPLSHYLLSRQTKDLSNKDQQPEIDVREPVSWNLTVSAINHRKEIAVFNQLHKPETHPDGVTPGDLREEPVRTADSREGAIDDASMYNNPWDGQFIQAVSTDPHAPQPARVFVGAGLVSYPEKNRLTGETDVRILVHPGEDITLSTLKAGTPQPVSFKATVVDLFKCGMSEYDSNIVFMNLEQMQRARGMLIPPDPTHPNDNLDWKNGSVTAIQIKLKDYSKAPLVVQRLREELAGMGVSVETWEQQQGPLLQAVAVEAAILNVLLFLIIAVAGFGILAIFYMIVVEKTRDIGILKALGASSRGIMSIFLLYGLTLGLVGSGAGVALGLTVVHFIDQIEEFISWMLGHKVFDETIYYFHKVPTQVNPGTVVWVAFGAVLIAVMASILPARRAAGLHPVQALRYE